MSEFARPAPSGRTHAAAWLAPLVGYIFILGVYFVARFDGRWAEADSATFSRYIRAFVESGQLIPEIRYVYPNGYLDQAVSTFIIAVSGVDTATLQQVLYPLLAAIVVPAAWITYREITRSQRWATLCTLVLLMQPDFLFVVLRSSHEKFTRTLMFVCLFLIIRVLSQSRTARSIACHSVLLYVTVYALLASNYLLAASLILAIAFACGVGWLLSRVRPHLLAENRAIAARLPIVILISVAIAYLFTFHFYPPAQHDLVIIRQTWELMTALFTESASGSEDVFIAYSVIAIGWVNVPTYLILSLGNWLVLGVSAIIWLAKGVNWLIRRASPSNQTEWFVWLLYSSFVVQGVLAVVADASGALGSNLQVRLFPSFSIAAVALIGTALGGRFVYSIRRSIAPGLTAAAALLSVLAIIKATNEPLLSNKWNFYRSSELAAMRWVDQSLANADVWTEFDERLLVAHYAMFGDPKNAFLSGITSKTRTMIVSDVTQLRTIRTGQILPLPPDAAQIYDNGITQIHRFRPQTPYQK